MLIWLLFLIFAAARGPPKLVECPVGRSAGMRKRSLRGSSRHREKASGWVAQNLFKGPTDLTPVRSARISIVL